MNTPSTPSTSSTDSRQVAVITGAARGIGLGIATRLAASGMAVALLDRDAAALSDAVAGLIHEGHRAMGVTVDLTDSAAVNQAFETPLAAGIRFERRTFHATFAFDDELSSASTQIVCPPTRAAGV